MTAARDYSNERGGDVFGDYVDVLFGLKRGRLSGEDAIEREVRQDEMRVASEMEYASVRGISAPDY